MANWIAAFAFLASAALAHWATLEATPGAIMSRAMDAMETRGIPLHGFVLVPRATPQNQSVVRPSPDLAYSICRYDLESAPQGLSIVAGAYSGMASVSFFDAETNNFATFRLSEGRDTSIRLINTEMNSEADVTPGEDVAVSPSQKGLILIRRLASTAAQYDRVKSVALQDQCSPFDGGLGNGTGPAE